jgi:hypothetical protein
MTLWSAFGFAAPGLINYQGRLTDAQDNPIVSPVTLTFSFWDAESGGNQLGSGFQDADLVTPDENGIYNTLIGDAPDLPVPESIFSGESVWLNVNVEGEDLGPRQRITSAGYALQAGSADRVQALFEVESESPIDAGDVVALLENGKIRGGSGNRFSTSAVFTGNAAYITVTALDETRFLIAYRDQNHGNRGVARIGQVNGYSISYSPDFIFNANGSSYICTAALDANTLVIAYVDEGNSNRGTAIVASASGSSIAFGPPTLFNAAQTGEIAIAALAADRFVVAYRDRGNSHYGTVCAGTVSGASISFPAPGEVVFHSATTYIPAIAALDSNRFVLAWQDQSDSGKGKALIGDLSNTPNYFSGAAVTVFNAANTPYLSAAGLSSSRFVIAYEDNADACGKAILGDTGNGAGLFAGSQPAAFNAASSNFISAARLPDGRFAIAFGNALRDNEGTVVLGDPALAPDYFSGSSRSVFHSGACASMTAAALSPQRLIVAWQDLDNSKSGWAGVGELQAHEGWGTALGIAASAGATGDRIPVILEGISSGHSGLQPGSRYYALPDGSLSLETTDVPVGLALSAERLLVRMER